MIWLPYSDQHSLSTVLYYQRGLPYLAFLLQEVRIEKEGCCCSQANRWQHMIVTPDALSPPVGWPAFVTVRAASQNATRLQMVTDISCDGFEYMQQIKVPLEKSP